MSLVSIVLKNLLLVTAGSSLRMLRTLKASREARFLTADPLIALTLPPVTACPNWPYLLLVQSNRTPHKASGPWVN